MNNFMNTANGWRLPPFHSLTGDNGGNSRRGDGFNNFFSNNNNTSFAGTNNRNCINGSNVGVHTNLSDAGIPDGYQRVQCTQPAMVVHCCPGGTCILIGNGIAGNIWEHVTWPQDYECNLIPYPVQPNC
uniref:Uncharacterized protein n=1 Tax=Parascaris univalens TaxID=6257 RepID=A0A915APN2_PARUN